MIGGPELPLRRRHCEPKFGRHQSRRIELAEQPRHKLANISCIWWFERKPTSLRTKLVLLRFLALPDYTQVLNISSRSDSAAVYPEYPSAPTLPAELIDRKPPSGVTVTLKNVYSRNIGGVLLLF